VNPDVVLTIAFVTYAVLVTLAGIVGFWLMRGDGDPPGAE
jgi:hypothetical protein